MIDNKRKNIKKKKEKEMHRQGNMCKKIDGYDERFQSPLTIDGPFRGSRSTKYKRGKKPKQPKLQSSQQKLRLQAQPRTLQFRTKSQPVLKHRLLIQPRSQSQRRLQSQRRPQQQPRSRLQSRASLQPRPQ